LSAEELKKRLSKEPFAEAIVYLQENLKVSKSPIEKQRCLTHVTVLISQAIIDHFSGVEFASKKSKLTLDADTLINLCVFVLLKAQCAEIYGHLKLANQFATNQIRNSKLGYVSSTIEVSIEQILTLEED